MSINMPIISCHANHDFPCTMTKMIITFINMLHNINKHSIHKFLDKTTQKIRFRIKLLTYKHNSNFLKKRVLPQFACQTSKFARVTFPQASKHPIYHFIQIIIKIYFSSISSHFPLFFSPIFLTNILK